MELKMRYESCDGSNEEGALQLVHLHAYLASQLPDLLPPLIDNPCTTCTYDAYKPGPIQTLSFKSCM